jgi:protoheme IX farnesyltransferase
MIADPIRENETMKPSDSQHTPDGTTARGFRLLVGAYFELAKARLASMVVLTALVGYVLGARGTFELSELLWAVVGTALSAFGANILNQVAEQDRDRLMVRTRNRPLPAGRVTRGLAAAWGVASSVLGVAILAVAANWLTAGLSLFTIVLYVAVYTPLKTRTSLNTVVGAVCGATPPMMGWAAATGRLDLGAWILGGILFMWQVPHFLALAWMYREDYARGGFRMLPAVDHPGALTARLAFIYTVALLPITASLTMSGVSGTTFLVASQILGFGFVVLGWRFFKLRADLAAKRLFLASIIYLPILLGLMVADMDDRISHIGSSVASTIARDQPVATSSVDL